MTLSRLTKRFGTHAAVNAVSLELVAGEFVAVLGPSGCGKTTLLRLLAGFERADDGELHFGDRLQAAPGLHVPPERRGIGMVFQSYALWPHMNVAENVGYPLRVKRIGREAAAPRVARALAQVGMAEYAARRPADLSGGQRQRVALARCLVMEPAIVLFDEPLANLDVHLRESMQAEFRKFHRETGATIVYVTHDQAEAMALADRIVVMDNGVVQQVAAPRTLYAEPASAMVARFVGRGMVVDAQVLEPEVPGGAAGQTQRVAALGAELAVRGSAATPGAARLCLRPEQLRLGSGGIAGTVTDVVYRGPVTTVTVRAAADENVTLEVDTRATPPGLGESVGVLAEDGWCFRES